MTEIAIPYGKDKIKITIPQRNVLDIIQPLQTEPRDSRVVLNQALENPLQKHYLTDFLKTEETVLCIVNDATRPTRTALFLDTVGENLRTGSAKFLIATGAHRPPSTKELRLIFGDSYARFETHIMMHDARDKKAMAYFGKTRYGNDLLLNKALTEHEKILIIGSVEPHYFAGFTGGRKSILPGVAGYSTIEQNHKHAVHPKARPLSLDGNPLHEEMTDCLRALNGKELFSVQMVLDKDHHVYDAFAGPVEQTFEMAARSGARLYRKSIARKTEVVVTVAQQPFDINLYQTLKAIEHGRMAILKDGILIVVSPCREGLGPVNFARLFDDSKSIETAAHSALDSYQLGDHNAINLGSLREFCEVWIVTGIPAEILGRAGFKRFASVQHAIDRSLQAKGKSTEILFMLDGSLTVPHVQ